MAEQYFRRFLRDDLGQDLIEYALLLALITILCIAGMQVLGGAVNGMYANEASTIEAAR